MSEEKPNLYSKWLAYLANKAPLQAIRKSAFRKFTRRNTGNSFITQCTHGFHMKTTIGDNVENKIAVFKQFEGSTTGVIATLSAHTDSFIDIGCNIGYFSCLYGHMHPNKLIIALDPNPEMADRTTENLKINQLSNTAILNAGAGSKESVLELNIPKFRHSLASFAYKPTRGGQCTQVSSKIVTLDFIVSEHSIANSLLKIDTEGFEVEVLSGLSAKNFKNIKFIICEVSTNHLEKSQQSLQDFLDLELFSSFDIYKIIEKSGPKLIPQTPNKLESGEGLNENILFANRSAKIPQSLLG